MDLGQAPAGTERVDTHLFVTPQLRPQDMALVAAAGFRSIVNNRPDGEGGADQPPHHELAAAAAAAGLAYRHLPVPPSGHTEHDARRMCEAVESLPKPTLAFCRTGRRSRALYAMGLALPRVG